MAKGQKTGGRNFKPGQSGNPDGRPPVPADLREARKINQLVIERLFNEFLWMPKAELTRRYKAPETPAIERMLIQLVRSSQWGGDKGRIGFILQRIVGTVSTKVEAGAQHRPELGARPEDMTPEEIEKEAAAIAKVLVKKGR